MFFTGGPVSGSDCARTSSIGLDLTCEATVPLKILSGLDSTSDVFGEALVK